MFLKQTNYWISEDIGSRFVGSTVIELKFSYWFTSPLLCLIASRFSFLLAGVCYWVITWEGWKIDCIWAVLLDYCREGDRHVYSFLPLFSFHPFSLLPSPFSYKFFCSMKNSEIITCSPCFWHSFSWLIIPSIQAYLSYNIYACMNNEDNSTS